jgi:cell division septal protein FtsQ
VRWNFHQQKVERRRRQDQPVYKNPLFTKPSWRLFVIERFSFFGWLVILVALIIAYLLFYSPLLRITTVAIDGTQNISTRVLKERYVDWQLQQQRLKIFPQNNLIMFSKKWLTELISRDYSLASLKIKKQWPHTLVITLSEKNPELVWMAGSTYFYLGENGDIASQLPSQEMAAGIPTIVDDSNTAAKVGQPVLTRDKVVFIEQLIDKIRQIPSIEAVAYHMISGAGTQVNVQTAAGYVINFDTSKNIDAQVTKLQRILDDQAFKDNPPKEYIDVRLGDRVYYK